MSCICAAGSICIALRRSEFGKRVVSRVERKGPVEREQRGLTHSRVIFAHHLILHGYGHWLPNDPRGSGSIEVREEKLVTLGNVHHGRRRVQPSREALKGFYRKAEPLLEHTPIWFDDAKRQALGQAFGETIGQERYTVWACAILRNHVHFCIRRHRDNATIMWRRLAEESSRVLRLFAGVGAGHPVWSKRPYKVFLYDRGEVARVIDYIENNPVKEGLPKQTWPFVTRLS